MSAVRSYVKVWSPSAKDAHWEERGSSVDGRVDGSVSSVVVEFEADDTLVVLRQTAVRVADPAAEGGSKVRLSPTTTMYSRILYVYIMVWL